MAQELSSAEQMAMLLDHMNTLVELMEQEIKQLDANLSELAERMGKARNANTPSV